MLRSGGIQPFSTTQATYARVDRLAEEQGDLYGQILRRLEELGVPGPRARDLADDLMVRYEAEMANTGANKAPANVFRNEAENLRTLFGPTALPGPAPRPPRPPRGTAPSSIPPRPVDATPQGPWRVMPLGQSENIKRALQRDARFERLRASPREENLQEASSMVRQAIEDAVEEAGRAAGPSSEVGRLAQQFRPVKQRTGRLLEARTAAERGASKAEQRSSVGLKDMILGSATGEPLSALGVAAVSNLARNRLPSTAASYGYGLSEGLRTGSAAPELARIIELALNPDVQDTTATLIELLQERQRKRKEQ